MYKNSLLQQAMTWESLNTDPEESKLFLILAARSQKNKKNIPFSSVLIGMEENFCLLTWYYRETDILFRSTNLGSPGINVIISCWEEERGKEGEGGLPQRVQEVEGEGGGGWGEMKGNAKGIWQLPAPSLSKGDFSLSCGGINWFFLGRCDLFPIRHFHHKWDLIDFAS